MDVRTTLLTIFLCTFVSHAWCEPPRKFAWRIENFSVLYGFTYYHHSGFAHSVEALFDRSRRNRRIGGFDYFGFGFVGSFNNDFKEIGMKFILTPRTKPILMSRRTKIFPFAYVQGNLRTINAMSEANKETGNIRLGAGLNGDFQLWRSPIVTKPSLNIGYTLADRFTPLNRGLTVEFRLGIGIQTWRFR